MNKLLPYIFIVILISAAAITTWIIRTTQKPVILTEFPVWGQAMLPTFEEGDLVYYRTDFRQSDLRRGMLVVYKPAYSQSKSLKRIVAVAGDTILFDKKSVFLNGKLLDEPYLYAQKSTDPGNYKENSQQLISDSTVFLLGDNRQHSYDSRSEGPVPLVSIVGVIQQ